MIYYIWRVLLKTFISLTRMTSNWHIYLSSDGVHLNSNGTFILLFNILSVFSKFDRNLMDFKDEYQNAISMC